MKLYTPLGRTCYFGDSDLMSNLVPITVAHGDGIGPEIMEDSLHIIKEVPAQVAIDGIDVYVAWPSLDTNKLAASIQKANGDGLELTMIDNRGVKVWPDGLSETLFTDAYRCRFTSKKANSKQTVALLGRVLDQGVEIVKTETLRTFDGEVGYTLSQGQ